MGQIKTGSTSRGERIAKYNRFLEMSTNSGKGPLRRSKRIRALAQSGKGIAGARNWRVLESTYSCQPGQMTPRSAGAPGDRSSSLGWSIRGGVMPEPGPVIARTRVSGELNDVQRRRLDATCKYIDSLLCEIEHALHSPQSESPFHIMWWMLPCAIAAQLKTIFASSALYC